MRRLGAGGMGAVWLARDELIGRDVAIKQLLLDEASVAPEAIERAMREARLAGQLNSPYAVGLYDMFLDAGRPVLVMEYVAGPTLAQVIKANAGLAPDEARRILHEVAEAVSAAHALGIVHRDIKPANVLLTVNGQAKLADFGIARAESEASITATGSMLGTLAYMAPEVANGSPANPASDMWSMGALLFAMVEGVPPFDGDSAVEILMQLVRDPVPSAPRASELTPILSRLLDRDPTRRFTAAGLVDALRSDPLTPTKPYPVPMAPAALPTGSALRSRGLLIGAVMLVALLVGALAFALSRGGSGLPPSPFPTNTPAPSSSPTASPSPSTLGSVDPSWAARWGPMSSTSVLPDSVKTVCSYDSVASPVSAVGLAGAGADKEACKFATGVGRAYAAQPIGNLGKSNLQIVIAGKDQNSPTMTCNGTGPVECTGTDPSGHKAYDVWLAALPNGNWHGGSED